MVNIIVALVLLLISGGAGLYTYKAKKQNRGCIGCPHAKQCAGCCSCEPAQN